MEEVTPKIQVKWEGKQKGQLQVLWEQGWIDTTRLNDHIIER
jgi:hypothetical protein